MKTRHLKMTLLVLAMSLLATNCTNETDFEEPATIENRNLEQQRNNQIPAPEPLPELIIKYAPHINTEKKKQDVRDRYDVQAFQKCNCQDAIELWIFSVDVDIEDTREEAETDDDVDEVDVNSRFPMDDFISNNPPNPNNGQLQNLIKDTNSGVTIAILDTGLDYTDPIFEQASLYRHENTHGCKGKTLYDTWDYTNDSQANLLDSEGHGTYNAKIIYQQAVNKGIDFQILPIKIFDSKGRATLFEVLCGMMYAEDLGADIVNMSFGWYYIRSSFISELIHKNDHVLYVASAGNYGVNVDEVLHFPSNIRAHNIISAAGINAGFDNLSEFSNYGTANVDIAASSENIRIGENGEPRSGTSFAAAYVSARGAQLFTPEDSPGTLMRKIIASGTYLKTLEELIQHPVYLDENE